MRAVVLGGVMGAILLTAGCAWEDVKRTVYNSLSRQEELKSSPNDRRDSPSYDEYQRSRQHSTDKS